MGLRIAIGSDHGGFEGKQRLAGHLASRGHVVVDCGTYSADSADYPVFAWRVARQVACGGADRGVILCRSGNGVAIVANKHPGVRAGIATSPETAHLAMSHNEANVLVVGCDHVTFPVEALVDAWLAAEPEGGRHHRRVRQITGIDRLLRSTVPAEKMALAGQSVWLLEAPANLPAGATLASLVERSGVRGLLTDGGRVAQSIRAGRGDYGPRIAECRAAGLGAGDAWMRLVVEDARRAAEALEPVFAETAGDDGYVAVEPGELPGDESGLMEAVRRLLGEIARPNVAVALPGTAEGLRALRTLTTHGVSTVALHLYSPGQVQAAAQAYTEGLAACSSAGASIHGVRSFAAVAVPTLAEALGRALAGVPESSGADPSAEHRLAMETLGYPAALAIARRLHDGFRTMFLGAGFAALARAGAAPQRLMWLDAAEGGERMRPPLPVEDLAAPFTVACVGPETLAAMNERAVPEDGGLMRRGEAEDLQALDELAADGIDIEALGAALRESATAEWRQERQRLAGLLGEIMAKG